MGMKDNAFLFRRYIKYLGVKYYIDSTQFLNVSTKKYVCMYTERETSNLVKDK